MGNPGFNLMITGNLVEGVREERAVAGLARLLSVDEARAKALLDGKERIIKRNINMDVLPRYQAALRKIGVESRFRPALSLLDDEPLLEQKHDQSPAMENASFTVAETGASLPRPSKPEPVSVDAQFVLFEPGADLEPIPRDLTPPALNIDHLRIDTGD